MTKIVGFLTKTRSNVTYPDCPSVIKPIPHDIENHIPKPSLVLEDGDTSKEESPEES